MAGEQKSRLSWPHSVHTGKQGGITDKDANKAGQHHWRDMSTGNAKPASGYKRHAGQHNSCTAHSPPTVSKGAKVTGRSNRYQAGDRPQKGCGKSKPLIRHSKSDYHLTICLLCLKVFKMRIVLCATRQNYLAEGRSR